MSFHDAYSPREVLIIYGVDISEGKSDDAFITISRNSERVTTRAGNDGRYSATLSADRGGTVTLSYFPESNSAKLLQGIYTALQQSNTLGDLPLVIIDPSGTLVVAAAEATLSSTGDMTLGTDTGTIDFVFTAPELITAPADLPDEVQDLLNQARDALGI